MKNKSKQPNTAGMDAQSVYRLLCERDESALPLLDKLYGRLLRKIAGGVLRSKEDAEEVVNDALHDLWRGPPPDSAESLKAHAASICRRQAIDRLRTLERKKRRADFTDAASELEETFTEGFENSIVDSMVINQTLSRFIAGLGERDRTIFLKRFYLFQTPEKIAASLGVTRNLVYVNISRMKEKLRKELEENLQL